MRQARFLRGGLAALALGWVGSAGCYHPYYYQNPLCDPATQPAVVGSVDPATGAITQGARSSTVSGSTPRSVVSKPRGFGAWKQSAPESEAPTTIVEGALESEPVRR